VELRAVLGQAEFTLDELGSLRLGDVIALDRRSPDPVEIYLEERRFCLAQAGLAGQRIAFSVIAPPVEETEH
jgi:flagellar motor switch protein FliM